MSCRLATGLFLTVAFLTLKVLAWFPAFYRPSILARATVGLEPEHLTSIRRQAAFLAAPAVDLELRLVSYLKPLRRFFALQRLKGQVGQAELGLLCWNHLPSPDWQAGVFPAAG
jgi:hypothetical protein